MKKTEIERMIRHHVQVTGAKPRYIFCNPHLAEEIRMTAESYGIITLPMPDIEYGSLWMSLERLYLARQV